MPESFGNVADLVGAAASRASVRPALVDVAAGVTMTWGQVNAAVNRFAAQLVRDGLAPGDRVALRLPTGAAFCVTLLGVLRAGGVAVPIDVDAAPRELHRLLEHSGARLLVGAAEQVDGVRTLDVPEPAGGDAEPIEPVEPAGGGEDLAVLCYTSGTAGLPRGVMLSHRALLANVAQCAALRPAPVTATDRVLLSVPLSHAYGLGPGLLQVASAGATAVLLDRFGVEAALRACVEHRVTAMVGVPAMFAALVGAGDRLAEAFASMRLLTSGAAPLPVSVLAAVRGRTGLTVFEGYGLTETGPVLTSSLVGGLAKPGSVGRAIPGVELRLVDNDGRPLDPDDEDYDDGDTGLVSARGDNLFSGYWPDGAYGPDAQGWFRTGDVGYFDADGDLHLVDRANDLIIVNGFNVYPHEVERVLDELPQVAEAAAVGVPDERSGERVKAVLVLRADAELTAAAVVAHCAQRLARFKVPATVEFVDSLPHSATGKLRRASLRGTA